MSLLVKRHSVEQVHDIQTYETKGYPFFIARLVRMTDVDPNSAIIC